MSLFTTEVIRVAWLWFCSVMSTRLCSNIVFRAPPAWNHRSFTWNSNLTFFSSNGFVKNSSYCTWLWIENMFIFSAQFCLCNGSWTPKILYKFLIAIKVFMFTLLTPCVYLCVCSLLKMGSAWFSQNKNYNKWIESVCLLTH